MADQPDIQVTDGAASPPQHVTVSVDGHETIVHQDDATQFIRDAYEQNK